MASDIYDRTRMVFAKMPDESYPIVIGAASETTWEVIPPDDWDRIKREWADKWLGPDWTAYEFVEVVVTIPSAQVEAMFSAREITPESVTEALDEC